MKTIPMNFRFKGSRNYVHGTDMYNDLVAQIEKSFPDTAPTTVKLTFHKFAYKQCNMLLGEPGEILIKPERGVSELIVDIISGRVWAWLVETDQIIEGRYDFDEQHIANLCEINDQRITIAGNSGYSPIEVIVPMTKHLHNHLFYSEGVKWAFTRLELNRLLNKEDAPRFAIEFKQDFNNNRLTKSLIYAGDEDIGYIYFSRVK